MSNPLTVQQALIDAIRRSSVFNPEVQVKPACILWPDRDRQWEAIIPTLQGDIPELMVLGDYAPEERVGPAVWLRCVIADKSDDVTLSPDSTPILYLPGVSRQDLRAVESCADDLKPLAELQYRGVIWSQINAKDWTILAFLKSDQGGLGLDAAQDSAAKNAMQLALYRLLDEDVALLKGKRLDKDYFNTLLTGGDPVRDLLRWLDQGDAFIATQGENAWKAFVEVIDSQLGFNPHNDGVLAGAEKLAEHEGPWKAVWERFCEAPNRYPNIPKQIEKCQPPAFDLFADASTASGWPQWNSQQERKLQGELKALEELPPHEARKRLLSLEKEHRERRSLVWAELNQAPLSKAMEHLAILADVTNIGLNAGTLTDIVDSYTNSGWRADDAVLRALELANDPGHIDAITIAIRAAYLPWIEESARHLQHEVDGSSYPGGTIAGASPFAPVEDECILFVDGLRFDTAKRLQQRLEGKGLDAAESSNWIPLPSVTATGKAAASPVRHLISGDDGTMDFEPLVAETKQSLKGGYHFKKLLGDAGWTLLGKNEPGTGKGRAWTEVGDIDHEGHDRGWKLGKHVESLLAEVADRVETLLNAGWKQVRVVTDHGWLLMPGGLPKIDLPSALTDNKWGRCASLKSGVSTQERLFPWYWNPNQHFVLADGISCFRKGEEYTHGGLTLQECLTLELVVSRTGSSDEHAFEITDVVWKGLRCTVAVDGSHAELRADIRTEAGNTDSSVVLSVKSFKENGTSSLVVEDEELEGKDAFLVLTDATGSLVAQIATVIGGE